MRTPARILLAAAIAVAGLFTPATAVAATPSDPSVMIVNGRPATENYSFMVYVSGCTGSLIKANWAVTAKHCPTPSSVRVGSIDRSSGGTVVAVRRAVNHPRIDVKLLELASNVSYAPAPIPTTSGAVGTATRLIGWGQTCPTRGCGSAPRIANESCGKCVPCREGGTWLSRILERVVDGHGTMDDLDQLYAVGETICPGAFPHASSEKLGLEAVPFPYKMTTICFVGPSAYTPVHSALTLFRDEFEARVAPSRKLIPVLAVGVS